MDVLFQKKKKIKFICWTLNTKCFKSSNTARRAKTSFLRFLIGKVIFRKIFTPTDQCGVVLLFEFRNRSFLLNSESNYQVKYNRGNFFKFNIFFFFFWSGHLKKIFFYYIILKKNNNIQEFCFSAFNILFINSAPSSKTFIFHSRLADTFSLFTNRENESF